MAACISTWTFGVDAARICSQNLAQKQSGLDSVENAIKELENNPKYGPYIVGRGGFPNSQGVLQLDAAIMNGKECQFGAVAALEGVSTPICVARKVMEVCDHNILVGPGAQQFARRQGFTIEENSDLLTEAGKEKYKVFQATSEKAQGHDTLGLIALDHQGSITVGVSSSGMPFKHPGRVGDSPLPGGGLYADDQAGAACCTGDGDQILRFCPSFHVVQLLRIGTPPQVACQQVVSDIANRCSAGGKTIELGVIAMNMKGEYGAAGTIESWTDCITQETYNGLPYAVWNEANDNCELKVQGRVSSLQK